MVKLTRFTEHSGSIPRNARVACETWLCVTTKKVWLPDRQTHTHRQTPDKVIPMCRYASQATQKLCLPDRNKHTHAGHSDPDTVKGKFLYGGDFALTKKMSPVRKLHHNTSMKANKS